MKLILPFIVVLLFLLGCDQQPAIDANADPVLVKVGDSVIRQSQFDAMLGRMSLAINSEETKLLEEKILQGLVRTRVLAITSSQQMSDEERLSLDAKVLAYKDELLAQIYIQKNITPEPVTTAMVNEYYQNNLDDYSTPGKIRFETISTNSTSLDDDILGSVINALSMAKNNDDWKNYTNALKQKNLPVEYRSALMLPSSINNVLRVQIDGLKPGEVSDIISGETIHILKLINREPDSVKPVYTVSNEIRKKLAPLKLKEQLTQHIDRAQQSLAIEFVK